jgi:PmbA protein
MSTPERPSLLLETVLSLLASHGARGDVYLEHSRTAEVQVRAGEIEAIRQAETRGIGIRAMVDGRLGFAHTTALDGPGLDEAVAGAVALAAHASAVEILPLAGPTGLDGDPSRPARDPASLTGSDAPANPGSGSPSDPHPLVDEGETLRLRDPAADGRTMESRAAWIRTAESAARTVDDRVTRTESASVTDGDTAVWVATTEGLRRHYRKSLVTASIEVVAEHDRRKQSGNARTAAVHWAALPSAAGFGRKAGIRAVRLLGGEPVRTGSFPVVWSPEVGGAPLEYLRSALDGKALSQGRSWLAGDVDPRIGSDLVTIRDRGRLPGGVGSCPFDGEGVDTGETILVDRGVVKGRLTDLTAAARLGEPSSGNARRQGYASLPGIGAHNLTLDPGSASRTEIVSGVREGFWVWSLAGWWIGNDPSNPTFSSAASGLWIEFGKVVRPVARVTLSAPLRDLFGGVEAVGSDLVLDAATCTPTYRVRKMTVSGE